MNPRPIRESRNEQLQHLSVDIGVQKNFQFNFAHQIAYLRLNEHFAFGLFLETNAKYTQNIHQQDCAYNLVT